MRETRFILRMNNLNSLHSSLLECFHTVCKHKEVIRLIVEYDDSMYNEADNLIEQYHFYIGKRKVATAEEHEVVELREREDD